MKSKKSSVTTIETHEVWVIRRLPQTVFSFCPECGVEARMIEPVEAAKLAQASLRAIYRWVEEGRVHFTETPVGEIFICFNSLP